MLTRGEEGMKCLDSEEGSLHGTISGFKHFFLSDLGAARVVKEMEIRIMTFCLELTAK